MLSGCGTGYTVRDSGPPPGTLNPATIQDATPRVEPRSRYGNPESYEVFGRRYFVRDSADGYLERGGASWYGNKFHGQRTSSGEPYDMYAMTAAHRTLPLPTYVRVTNLDNGLSTVVKVNDRGPFHDDRIIDLSYAAATKLGILHHGTGRVEVRAIDPSAPVAQPVAKTSRPAREPDPPWILQVGTFSDRRAAENLRVRLRSYGLPPVRVKTTDSPTPKFRVQIGPIRTRTELQNLDIILARMGLTDTRLHAAGTILAR